MPLRLGRTGSLLLAAVLTVAPFAARPQPIQDCPFCPDMVELPALTRNGHAERWAMGRTEITFDQWQACVDAKSCRGGQDDHLWGRGDRPIINVTWQDAKDYADWLASTTGQPYTLPPEDVWEFAARAGTATDYPWGDKVGRNHANCRDCGSKWSGISTAPVASFKPNPYGLYDMNGNVWEWVDGCWDQSCAGRIIRGGAWYYFSPMSKSTARARFDPKQWSYTIGLRVAKKLSSGE